MKSMDILERAATAALSIVALIAVAARAESQESAPSAHGLHSQGMDRRQPLPLSPMMAQHQKENMREHLIAVQQIVAALARDDFDAVAAAAKPIGYSEEMAQMCTHMGAGAPGFTEMALTFHRTADTIGEAATRRDRAAVLAALGNTLQTCTACHAAYRQEIIADR
jgi:cytochrome c556